MEVTKATPLPKKSGSPKSFKGRGSHNERLKRAKASEDTYSWLNAGQIYRGAAEGPFSEEEHDDGAVLLFRSGSCFYRSAFQAKNLSEFEESLKLAIKSYEDAHNLWMSSNSGISRLNAARSRASGSIAKARLTIDPGEKRKNLAESIQTLGKAVAEFDDSSNVLPVALSLYDLATCFALLLDFEWDPSKRRSMIQEAMGESSRASSIFEKFHKNKELAWMYYLDSVLASSARFLLEDEASRQKADEENVSSNEEARRLSKRVKDALLRSKINLQVLNVMGYTHRNSELFDALLNQGLKSAREARDNEAIADSLLARGTDLIWEMAGEEDPNKRMAKLDRCRKVAEEASGRYRLVQEDGGESYVKALVLAQAHYRMATIQSDITKRRELLETAANNGRAGLALYRKSARVGEDSPARTLMVVLYNLALTENDTERKTELLTEALGLRDEILKHEEAVNPYHNWNRGVVSFYPALIKAQLSALVPDPGHKATLLREAAKAAEEALHFCKLHFAHSVEIPKSVMIGLATYSDQLASMLEDLHRLTGDTETDAKLFFTLREASDYFERGGWSSRAAESRWRMGMLLDRSKQYFEASREFEKASELYRAAGETLAPFKVFFREYEFYMKAWCEIDVARQEAEIEDYRASSEHYRKAIAIISKSTKWSHLAVHYLAWSFYEEGEGLSKEGNFKDSAAKFGEASKQFLASDGLLKELMNSRLPTLETEELQALSDVTSARMYLSEGRATIEEAKSFDQANDKLTSSHKFALAARTFERVLSSVPVGPEHDEVETLVSLCKGWEMMKIADYRHESSLYVQASSIFSEVAESKARKAIVLLAKAEASLCKAMNLVVRFQEAGGFTFYESAKIELQIAKEGYEAAGLRRAADWAAATMSLLDARFFTVKAETSADPASKTKFLQSAEKYLEYALSISDEAGYASRKEEIARDLNKLKQRVELSPSLVNLFATPVAGATGSLLQASIVERAKGLSAFDGPYVQAQLRVGSFVEVGSPLELHFDLFNTGKKPAALVRIDGFMPNGFGVLGVPSGCTVEGKSLAVAEKRLEPLRIESITISLKAEQAGEAIISPRVICVDELGKTLEREIESKTIAVVPHQQFEFRSSAAKLAFDFLVEAFVEDYMRRRLYEEQAGWRSLTQVAKKAHVSVSSLYGRQGKHGPVLYELLSRGIVESRTFSGQRGRGGQVLKVRVYYQKDPVKRYVTALVMNK